MLGPSRVWGLGSVIGGDIEKMGLNLDLSGVWGSIQNSSNLNREQLNIR